MISINRRAMLVGVAGGLLGFAGIQAAGLRGDAGPLFVGCRADSEGKHYVSGFKQRGDNQFSLPLPDRGHAMAFHPKRQEMVVFARRPGNFAVVIDDDQGVALYRIDASPGRHFYGHGTFSPDGRILFATENDYARGEGVIGLYDAGDHYRRVDEYPSHGIGPHELILMPDGKTLAVANGGIRTHPDQGRAKLNLDDMTPSLVFADTADGRCLDQAVLSDSQHQLSIRHLAMLNGDRIAIAMQYEGSKADQVPLVGIHEGSGIQMLQASSDIQRRMRHYGGSVAVDRSGEIIAVSAPRGNLVTFWDGRKRRYLSSTELADGCGVAPTDKPGEFLLTGGEGDIRLVQARDNKISTVDVDDLAAARWDNHLRLVPQRQELS
ncbi:MAG: DUF1513 domain-containing protein [Pseudomonadota bacterium]